MLLALVLACLGSELLEDKAYCVGELRDAWVGPALEPAVGLSGILTRKQISAILAYLPAAGCSSSLSPDRFPS